MKKHVIVFSLFAAVLLWQGPANAQPAPFECPWTPVTGNAPFADGCQGGGTDGCGAQADNAPDIPCEDRQPPETTSSAPPSDVIPAVAQARNELIAAGVDLSGANCGKIVERACNYMSGGAGLLVKTSGFNYNGHSVDYIVMPDGNAWDVVVACDDGTGGTPGVGNTGCCGPATGCEPNSRYMACPPLQPLP